VSFGEHFPMIPTIIMPSPSGTAWPWRWRQYDPSKRIHKFSKYLDARRVTWSKVHTKDPKFWSEWYTFYCVRKGRNCNNWMKILSTTLCNLVTQDLCTCFETLGTLAQQGSITSEKTVIFCNTAVRTSDLAPLIS
jgi:hypothetical protein